MDTPLTSAVQGYMDKQYARFHMPGHKGAALPPLGVATAWDITEVAGADSLFEASGPIAGTEARYAALYGTAGSFLSAGGSTLCIQAMLALAARPGGKLLCGRGVHTAAVNAMALLGLEPEWIYPGLDPDTGLPQAVTAEQVRSALDRHPDTAVVYLTSPDYFGVLCDVKSIAGICHGNGIPLVVDNAHGSHLRFLERDLHPMSLGADLCCDSLHKTLPVLTGGALLQVENSRYLADARRRMSLFGSTSPSYLVLLSIDAALPYLERQVRQDLAAVAIRVAALEQLAAARGFLLPKGKLDPVRLAVGFAPLGLSAGDFRAHLDRCRVEPEYLSGEFCVFLAGGHNSGVDFERLETVIRTAPQAKCSRQKTPEPLAEARRAMPLREAVFSPFETVEADRAAGRICAAMVAPCPPGVPLAIPGERLDKTLCARLKKYGILSVNVVI